MMRRLASSLGNVLTMRSPTTMRTPNRSLWWIDAENMNPEIAYATLAKKMRSQVNKQRIKLRGFKPKSQIKYERRRRYKYKASYLKVQETLNYIELSRTMMAHRRRQDKLFPPEEYVDRLGIMEAPDDATFPGEIVINRELAPLVKPVPPPGGAVPPFPPQKN